MHFAAHAGDLRNDQKEAGWTGVDEKSKFDWETMVGNVQAHIKRLNWGYRT
jgi:thioredoxin reductase (NADPH)